MDIPRDRRGRTMEQVVQDKQSSDDEMQFVDQNQTARNKRIKKTVRKVKDKDEVRLERTLRESGIDCTGMTREEMVNIAQVVMMSKQEADGLQMDVDEISHSDSEEIHLTTEAFQQAVHPSVKKSRPYVSQSNNTESPSCHVVDQSAEIFQRQFEQGGKEGNSSIHSTPPNSQSEQLSQQLLDSSIANREAFEAAIHPKSTPDDRPMEEDTVAVDTTERTRNSLNVTPEQQKHQRRRNIFKQDGNKQLVHVVKPIDKKTKGDNKKVLFDTSEAIKAIMSEDDESPPERKRINSRKTLTQSDIEDLISEDETTPVVASCSKKKMFQPDWKDLISEEEKTSCSKKKMFQPDWKDLISEEEKTSCSKKKMFQPDWKDLISEEENSPIKRTTRSAKKSFIWSEESDEETVNLIIEKESTERSEEIGGRIDSINNDSNSNGVDVENDDVEEPISEEFYQYPPLHRHYRHEKNRKIVKSGTLFAPPEVCPQSYTKVLIQHFSLYLIRLAQLQRCSKNYLKWPTEPVKVGYHLNTTIDVKKRGVDYSVLEKEDEIQSSTTSKSVESTDTVIDIEQITPKRPVRNCTFKRKNVPYEKLTPTEEEEDFVESSKLRSARTRSAMNEKTNPGKIITDIWGNLDAKPTRREKTANITAKQNSDEDMEPFSVNESFKICAEKGRKRQLYSENISQYCPIIEDENSSDFDIDFPTGKGGRIIEIKSNENSIGDSKPETQYKRNKPNSTMKDTTATRKSLRRLPSDLSVGSIESVKSEELNSILDPVRPNSRSSDTSVGGLSQSSDVLIDPQGQLYSTQFCAMKQKKAKLPHTISNAGQIDTDQEQSFQQYRSKHDDMSDKLVPSFKSSRNSTVQINENSSQASHSVWSDVTSILPKQSQTNQNPRQNDGKKSKQEEPSTSLNTRLFNSVNDLITLGSTRDKTNAVDDRGNHSEYLALQGIHTNNTQGFLTNDTTEDDLNVIKKEAKTYSKKQGRKRQLTGEDSDGQNKLPKISTVACPLCNREFPLDKIETHAADCNGPAGDDENSRSSSVDIQDIPGVRSISPSGSSIQRPNRGRMYAKQDQDAVVIEEDKSDEENPTKSDLTCYVCDKVCRNQKLYDQHVKKCLAEATQIQQQIDTKGLEMVQDEEEDVTRSKRITRTTKATVLNSSTEGYSSGSDNEKATLRELINGHSQSNSSTDSSIESSNSDEYDWSPAKTPPDCKPVNKENVLPGGWTLEELTNSPIKSFVPIWKQTDNEGFKAQFDKAKKRFERQQMKGKRKGKKIRKKNIKRKPAAKKMKFE